MFNKEERINDAFNRCRNIISDAEINNPFIEEEIVTELEEAREEILEIDLSQEPEAKIKLYLLEMTSGVCQTVSKALEISMMFNMTNIEELMDEF